MVIVVVLVHTILPWLGFLKQNSLALYYYDIIGLLMGLIKQYLVSTNQRFHIYVKIKQFNYYYYCYYEENYCTPTNLLNKAHSARVKPLQYSICVASLKSLT